MRSARCIGIAAMLLGLLLLSMASSMAAIQVEVNGSPLSFNVPPTQVNGRTMVPLRGIFESLGAQVNWNAYSRTITANKGDTDVQLGIGNRSAVVNGRNVQLDAPAMIRNGATLVPLRFVSEALGADVKWFSATQTVSITTDDGMAPIPSTTTNQAFIIPDGTVIPVKLDQALSSGTSRQGDAVSVSVVSAYDGDAEFPRGTKISGTVSEVQRTGNGEPGTLSLAFNRVTLPDGHSYTTEGTLVSLDEKMVKQTSDGRLVSRTVNKNNQLKFIGIGALGGFVLGKLTKHTLEGTLLGAAAGYLYSENQRKKMQPTDVSVAAGTEFGVQINRQLAYNPSRAFVVARGEYLRGRTSTNASTDSIRVTSGGRAIDFANAEPIDVDGVILVPLAPVMDRSNIPYKYDERLQAVTVDTSEGALQMNIGKSYALLNGERENLEAPAQVRNGVVYVPLHFLALATGTSVVWVADTRTVTLYNPT